MTEVLYPLRPVKSAQKEEFRNSFSVNGFDTIYGVPTLTICGDIATSQNPYVVGQRVRCLKDVMIVSLVDNRHRFATHSAHHASEALKSNKKEGLLMSLVQKRDEERCLLEKVFSTTVLVTTLRGSHYQISVS